MEETLQGLSYLPDVSGRRFGTVDFGYDRINKLREEYTALLALASLVLGAPPESLTAVQIANCIGLLQSGALVISRP